MYSAVVLKAYNNTFKSFPTWEKAAFFLGSYYYRCFVDDKEKALASGVKGGYSYSAVNAGYLTCKTYGKSLGYGSKYLHQSMPRLITTWLDITANSISENGKGDIDRIKKKIQQTNDVMAKLMDLIPKFQFLSAIPQLISRISHSSGDVQELLDKLLVSLLENFHQQTLWHLMAVAKSNVKSRANRVATIFAKARALDAKSRNANLSLKIQSVEQLSDNLIQLCSFPVSQDMTSLNLSTHFRKLHRLLSERPIDVIIPLQSSMIGSLPLPGSPIGAHRPFPNDLPTIVGFHDEIQILPSLQRPRKITIEGSDGQSYVFLCKSDDDLRKDSRLMEFNSIINKLLKKDSESRKRNLLIRTYTVVPLNEKCGLIQWIQNMNGYRNIMLKIYKSKGKYTHHQILKDAMDKAKTVEEKVKVFTKDILPRHPPVFREWFFEMFPEPTKWIASRKAYTSTIATMSMVGFVVGLGDRHGENLLFDENSGECLHVDLNCLFEKGLEFSVPERVPFRLTHNMVDAFGVYGVEGPFRKSCEATMNVLRGNRELLMSVLETFLHDPLCEWSKHKNSKITIDGENAMAVKTLKTIDKKLRGFAQQTLLSLSVAGQVDELISMATDPINLAQMYIGWAPFL
jgi:serine/threonine-protein kinase ATR